MKVVLTDTAHDDKERLFNRRVFLTNNTFCQSFIFYCTKIARDFDILKSGENKYVIKKGYRIATLSAIEVSYKLVPSVNTIIVYSIGFIGLRHLYRLCSFERRVNGLSLGRRPSNISASSSIYDYKEIPNGDGGEIRGLPVNVVMRKGLTSPSGKPLFNYIWNGKVISKIDFLSCMPFSDYNGKEKAYAYGANGKCYWVFPSGRRLIKETTQQRINRIITETINNLIREVTEKDRQIRIHRIIRESIDRFINQVVA